MDYVDIDPTYIVAAQAGWTDSINFYLPRTGRLLTACENLLAGESGVNVDLSRETIQGIIRVVNRVLHATTRIENVNGRLDELGCIIREFGPYKAPNRAIAELASESFRRASADLANAKQEFRMFAEHMDTVREAFRQVGN